MEPKPIIRKYKGYVIHYKRIYELWQWRKDNGEFVPSGDRTEDTDDWIIYLAKLIRNLRTKKKERITL